MELFSLPVLILAQRLPPILAAIDSIESNGRVMTLETRWPRIPAPSVTRMRSCRVAIGATGIEVVERSLLVVEAANMDTGLMSRHTVIECLNRLGY